MIIHHYYPQLLNAGDSFVRDGIRRLLRERAPSAQFVDVPVNRPPAEGAPYGLRGENLDRSNRQADLIVIGGSNLYQCRKSGPWGVTTDADSIKRISKPVILIGLGAGSSFKDTVRPCPPKSREEICLLNRLAVGSAVRDFQTMRFLDSLGLKGHVITGCPAAFVFDNPLRFNENSKAAISFPPIRFRKRHPLIYFRLVRAIRKYIAYCRDLGLEPWLSCHHPTDMEMARRTGGDELEVFFSENTEDYYERYSASRLVVGFRLHATIISLSLGVPFIPVSFDMRGTGFAETYESADRNIDGSSWGLYKRLVSQTQEILQRREEPFARFFANRDKFLKASREFVSRCLEKAGLV